MLSKTKWKQVLTAVIASLMLLIPLFAINGNGTQKSYAAIGGSGTVAILIRSVQKRTLSH